MVRLSTATAAVSHQLILWSLRNLAGLPDLDGVTVAVVISYPPLNQICSWLREMRSCTKAMIASTMKKSTAFAVW